MRRDIQLQRMCEMAGPVATVIDAGTGWPGLVEVLLPSGDRVRVALHISTVGPHSRKDYESRFQNPGDRRPVMRPRGALSILVGLATVRGRALFVATDGASRVDRFARFSILFNNNVLNEAQSVGWAMYQSSVGERIYAFVPALLPIYVEMVRDGLAGEFSDQENRSIQRAVSSAGISDLTEETVPERARRAANVLIRNYAFGGSVVRAYGSLCSMCGLNTGLVVGAHILPASAPNAPDQIWNGLALCHNHHAAFDLHKIWVDPNSRQVRFRPDVIEQAQQQAALRRFLENTFEVLSPTALAQDLPREVMFLARYGFFEGQYDWVAA